MDCLRHPSTGLVVDQVKVLRRASGVGDCPVRVTTEATSPTNIALDILLQLEAHARARSTDEALHIEALLYRIVRSLGKIPYEPVSGLFHNRFLPSLIESYPATNPIADPMVSSVDNLHLVMSLWAITQYFPGTQLAERAEAIFARMDFSVFYKEENGLWHGALYKQGDTFVVGDWTYTHLGSEARTIYSMAAGWNWMKSDPEYFAKIRANAIAEPFRLGGYHLMRTWDGGAFQLLLPSLLVGEEKYSRSLERIFSDYAKLVLDQASNHENIYRVPAAFSACQYGVRWTARTEPGEGDEGSLPDCGAFPCYNGKAGHRVLVSLLNQDLKDPAQEKIWECKSSRSSFQLQPHGLKLCSKVR